MSFAEMEDWPLILGIFGRPGDGKSYQARLHLVERQVHVVSINSADLESDRAGQPGKLVLSKYKEAGERADQGQPAALLVDDFDTTVGEWAHSTGTVNHQQVLAQLMHLADSPSKAADEVLRRIPVIVTGNDLTKVYPPLRRPGRLRPFTWAPNAQERHDMVVAIMRGLTDDAGVTTLIESCPRAPISFFADVRSLILATQSDSAIRVLAEKLPDVVKSPQSSRSEIERLLQTSRPTSREIAEMAVADWNVRKEANASFVEQGD